MYQWEKYKAYPHDHWWANFVRAARLAHRQLRAELGPDAKITWLVYRQGYRGPRETGTPGSDQPDRFGARQI